MPAHPSPSCSTRTGGERSPPRERSRTARAVPGPVCPVVSRVRRWQVDDVSSGGDVQVTEVDADQEVRDQKGTVLRRLLVPHVVIALTAVPW